MQRIFLLVFFFSISIFANSSKYLKWPEYKYQFFEKPRFLKALETSSAEDAEYRLAQAAVYFHEAKYDSVLIMYQGLKLEKKLQDVVDIRRVHCHLELQQFLEAKSILATLEGVKTAHLVDKISRLNVELLLKDTISTEEKYQALKKELQKKNGHKHQAWLHFALGEQALALKKEREAQRNFIQSFMAWSEMRVSSYQKALQITQKIGLPTEANILVNYVLEECKSAKGNRCLQILDTALQHPQITRQQRISLHRREADIFADQKKYAQAAERYQWLVDSVQMRSDYVQTLLRLRRNEGNAVETKKWQDYFYKNYPYSTENANALWVRGFEAEQRKEYTKAIDIYTRLSHDRFGNNLRKQWAPIRIGLIHLKQKQWQKAYNSLENAANIARNGWPQAAALYFQGMAMEKAGNNAEAKNKYVATIESFPLSWYAWLARYSLQDSLQVAASEIPQLQVLEMDRDSALQWVKKNFVTKAHAAYSPNLTKEIQWYFQTGFSEQAYDLIADSDKKYAKNPLYLYDVGSLLLANGEIGESYDYARKFINMMSRRRMHTLPAPVMQWMYPAPSPWLETMEKSLAQHELSPYFVLGVMRQESIFQSGITSPAGARGLMQIMPATGRNLAKKEKIAKFHPDLLYNPQMSIELGVRYLKDLMDEYKNPVYVLANYNAGPSPAKRWLRTNGSQPYPIEIEEISYWETRDYVKRVMGNYWLYQAAWGKK